MKFGQRLRELRKAKSMTQRELADKVGINFTYLSKLETGVWPHPGEQVILALARALDADPDELFSLARKIPPDIVDHLNAEMIKGIRSLQDGEDLRISGLSPLHQRITEPAASEIDRTQVEETHVEQEEFFRALIENFLDAIMVLNSELKTTYASPSTVRILGYEPRELDARGVFRLVHPDDMAKIAQTLTQLAQNPGEVIRNEARMRHKDGTWRVIEGVSHSLLHDPRVKGIVIIYYDITKRGLEDESRTEHMALAIMKEYHLTEAERKVFMLMAKGQSNPEIADRLMVGPSTVRFHVSNILFKLGVTSRTKAMALAMQHYLVI